MAKLMNWFLFEEKLKGAAVPVFTPLDIKRIFGISKIAVTFLLHRYTKRGRIIRLKRGLYSLAGVRAPDLYIANRLYEPSYVSLEFALSYHRIIPEAVYEITSITTKATRRFEAVSKIFTYRHIQTKAFTGYCVEKMSGLSFYIAEPEKAFADMAYFRIIDKIQPANRFSKNKMNKQKVFKYAALFENRKLKEILKKIL